MNTLKAPSKTRFDYIVGRLCLISILLVGMLGAVYGQGARRDTTICANTCVLLTAILPPAMSTDTYQVQSIPFQPPVSFQAGTPLVGLPDDLWSQIISLGFDFCFYDNTFSSAVISANGNLSFQTSHAQLYSSWPIYAAIPDSNAVDNGNSIMAPYQDIDPSINNREPAYGILGVAPYRKFFVNWDSIPLFQCNNKFIRSQLVLNETTNIVEIYLDHKDTCNSWNAGASIVGMEDSAALRAAFVSGHNFPTQWVASQEAWAFSPFSPNAYQVQWSSNGQNIGFGDSITVCPLSTTTYFGEYRGLNCTGDSLTIRDTIIVHVRPPLVTTPIIGPGTISPGQTGVSYEEPLVVGATGYHWLLQGGTFVGGANWRQVVVDWDVTGPYSLCVWPSDNYQCPSDTVCLSITVGIEVASSLTDVQLWPNPATQLLKLHGDFAGKCVDIQVADLSGKMVLKQQLLGDGSDLTVPIGELGGGYYFLRLQVDEGVRVMRFVCLGGR